MQNGGVTEEQWLKKWRKYDKNLKPNCFRIFSRYVGCTMDIMPLEFIASFVEPVLTPINLRAFYGDKNNFGLILPKEYMPTVYLRNIGGYLFDESYKNMSIRQGNVFITNLSHNVDRIIIKPTNSDSGRGVQMFSSTGSAFQNKEGEQLSIDYLNGAYGADWMIQQCVKQSDFCTQFNPTSVNTIRIATYRDINGKVHALSAGFRIGAKGAVIDNAHGGGLFCGVNNDGKLTDYVCDVLGRKHTSFNGVDFKGNEFIIPNWEAIRDFAVNISEHIIHHDLVALDIALDIDNNPTLIEFNVGGFGSWFFLMGGNSVFGEFTDEIAERCYKAYHKIEYHILSPLYRKGTHRRL